MTRLLCWLFGHRFQLTNVGRNGVETQLFCSRCGGTKWA